MNHVLRLQILCLPTQDQEAMPLQGQESGVTAPGQIDWSGSCGPFCLPLCLPASQIMLCCVSSVHCKYQPKVAPYPCGCDREVPHQDGPISAACNHQMWHRGAYMEALRWVQRKEHPLWLHGLRQVPESKYIAAACSALVCCLPQALPKAGGDYSLLFQRLIEVQVDTIDTAFWIHRLDKSCPFV